MKLRKPIVRVLYSYWDWEAEPYEYGNRMGECAHVLEIADQLELLVLLHRELLRRERFVLVERTHDDARLVGLQDGRLPWLTCVQERRFKLASSAHKLNYCTTSSVFEQLVFHALALIQCLRQ